MLVSALKFQAWTSEFLTILRVTAIKKKRKAFKYLALNSCLKDKFSDQIVRTCKFMFCMEKAMHIILVKKKEGIYMNAFKIHCVNNTNINNIKELILVLFTQWHMLK